MNNNNGRIEAIGVTYRVCGADSQNVYPDETLEVSSMSEAMYYANVMWNSHDYVYIEQEIKYEFTK